MRRHDRIHGIFGSKPVVPSLLEKTRMLSFDCVVNGECRARRTWNDLFMKRKSNSKGSTRQFDSLLSERPSEIQSSIDESRRRKRLDRSFVLEASLHKAIDILKHVIHSMRMMQVLRNLVMALVVFAVCPFAVASFSGLKEKACLCKASMDAHSEGEGSHETGDCDCACHQLFPLEMSSCVMSNLFHSTPELSMIFSKSVVCYHRARAIDLPPQLS